MDADDGRRKKRQRDGQRERLRVKKRELMLMWKCNETVEREKGGNKGGQKTTREEKRREEAAVVFSPSSLSVFAWL